VAVNFTNTSVGGSLTSGLWTFGDGGTSADMVSVPVTHTFYPAGCTASTNFVMLWVTNGLGYSGFTNLTPIVVYPAAPLPFFNPSSNSVTTNVPVTFTSTSTGCVSTYLWNFGDGQISTLANPTHAYSAVGTNYVTLAVTNAYGFGNISLPQAVVVTGSSVVRPTSVSIWKIAVQGKDLKLYGSNQPVTANAPFKVLWTNNAATARSNWLTVTAVTGDTAFNGLDGRFTNTITGGATNGSKGFFTIQVP
jgi:PKD repeat protein